MNVKMMKANFLSETQLQIDFSLISEYKFRL